MDTGQYTTCWSESGKQEKQEKGIMPRPKGRSRKDVQLPHQDEAAELKWLRMENKLLRDFLQFTERKWDREQSIMSSTVIGMSILCRSCVSSLVYPEAATTSLYTVWTGQKQMLGWDSCSRNTRSIADKPTVTGECGCGWRGRAFTAIPKLYCG